MCLNHFTRLATLAGSLLFLAGAILFLCEESLVGSYVYLGSAICFVVSSVVDLTTGK